MKKGIMLLLLSILLITAVPISQAEAFYYHSNTFTSTGNYKNGDFFLNYTSAFFMVIQISKLWFLKPNELWHIWDIIPGEIKMVYGGQRLKMRSEIFRIEMFILLLLMVL